MSIAAVAVKATGARGPQPPFRVCLECGAVSDRPWSNPLLVWAKKNGCYDGEVTGGLCLCDAPCAAIVKARLDQQSAPSSHATDVPIAFQNARMANYEEREGNRTARQAAEAFLKEGATGDLYLCGGVGTGKTRLAASVANEVVAKQHRSVQFVRVPVLLLKLQEGMHRDGEHVALSTLAEPGLLVLDDVGVEKGSDYSRRTLQTLYDMRLDAGRRTIWTSNLDLEALAAFLEDDRLPSRIAGAADIAFVDGRDQRIARRVPRQPKYGR